jgi:hypothetical protein
LRCVRLRILPFPFKYIFYLINFIVNNQETFHTISHVHSFNRENKYHLWRTVGNLSRFEKSIQHGSIIISTVNHAKSQVWRMDRLSVKSAFRRYLNVHMPFILSRNFWSSKMTYNDYNYQYIMNFVEHLNILCEIFILLCNVYFVFLCICMTYFISCCHLTKFRIYRIHNMCTHACVYLPFLPSSLTLAFLNLFYFSPCSFLPSLFPSSDFLYCIKAE